MALADELERLQQVLTDFYLPVMKEEVKRDAEIAIEKFIEAHATDILRDALTAELVLVAREKLKTHVDEIFRSI